MLPEHLQFAIWIFIELPSMTFFFKKVFITTFVLLEIQKGTYNANWKWDSIKIQFRDWETPSKVSMTYWFKYCRQSC